MTLRGNRKAGADRYMLTEKEMKKKGRGTFDYVSANGVQVCQWYDNKLVTVASTEFSVHPTDNCPTSSLISAAHRPSVCTKLTIQKTSLHIRLVHKVAFLSCGNDS